MRLPGNSQSNINPVFTCFVDFESDAIPDLPGECLIGTVRQYPAAIEQRPRMQFLRRDPALQNPHKRNNHSFLLIHLHNLPLKILPLI